jgi:hypothetical protein
MVLGVAMMAFATQTADEVQSPVAHKVQIAHWLETGLWVNPYLFLIGAVILLIGGLLDPMVGSRRMIRYAAIAVSSLIVMAAIAIFAIWEGAGSQRELDGVRFPPVAAHGIVDEVVPA